MITPPHLVRSQDLHSTSVGGDGADPKVTQPLSAWIERGLGTSGNSAQTELCPNAGPDTVIRSRKRSRDLKDVSGRVKRSCPLTRPREEASASEFSYRGADELSPAPIQPTSSPSPRPTETAVPPGPRPPVGAESFNDARFSAIVRLVRSAIKVNPDISFEQACALAIEHVRTHDPLMKAL